MRGLHGSMRWVLQINGAINYNPEKLQFLTITPFLLSIFTSLLEAKMQGINPKAKYIIASWKLRTHLILPWRPLILIDGTTTYDIDDQLRVIRHVESWKISALEAIGQIFTPGFLRSDK
ncbi:unnamed protein product [Coffea canephora]|uniref:Uncharacterized protein n=1 Tax=Coffea canephora TaxID=49390 RepID=A0A068UJA5_COFCA|nr:unnamed protein product [Coffea canephora]